MKRVGLLVVMLSMVGCVSSVLGCSSGSRRASVSDAATDGSASWSRSPSVAPDASGVDSGLVPNPDSWGQDSADAGLDAQMGELVDSGPVDSGWDSGSDLVADSGMGSTDSGTLKDSGTSDAATDAGDSGTDSGSETNDGDGNHGHGDSEDGCDPDNPGRGPPVGRGPPSENEETCPPAEGRNDSGGRGEPKGRGNSRR